MIFHLYVLIRHSFTLFLSLLSLFSAAMASSGDASPPHHSEKSSKRTQDPTASSWPTAHTKASLYHDAIGGHGARAHAAHAQAQAPPVGAATRVFIPGLGDVPTIDPAKEALDQEGRTIADDVCTMTPLALGYFGISRLIPFNGPTPTIREAQRNPNPAGGYTPHLMVDYRRHVAEIHCRCAQPLYDEPKDLRIEYRF